MGRIAKHRDAEGVQPWINLPLTYTAIVEELNLHDQQL